MSPIKALALFTVGLAAGYVIGKPSVPADQILLREHEFGLYDITLYCPEYKPTVLSGVIHYYEDNNYLWIVSPTSRAGYSLQCTIGEAYTAKGEAS